MFHYVAVNLEREEAGCIPEIDSLHCKADVISVLVLLPEVSDIITYLTRENDDACMHLKQRLYLSRNIASRSMLKLEMRLCKMA